MGWWKKITFVAGFLVKITFVDGLLVKITFVIDGFREGAEGAAAPLFSCIFKMFLKR